MQICGNCGTSNTNKAKHCEACGTLLKNPRPTAKTHTPINPQPNVARLPHQYDGPKKLYRHRRDRMIAGVCGGIGEHYNIDSNIVRILWAFAIFSGIGLIAYILAIMIIPESPYDPWSEPGDPSQV